MHNNGRSTHPLLYEPNVQKNVENKVVLWPPSNMKSIRYLNLVFFFLACSGKALSYVSNDGAVQISADSSIWIEPNFVDTQYSALLESQSVVKIASDQDIYDHIPFGWIPHKVKAKVLDVYKGDLIRGDEIDVLIYISFLSKNQIEQIKGQFLLSFCRSKSGIYYNSRDFLVQQVKASNLKKFAQIRADGTAYEGSGDCDGNYPSLNPDTHQ